jgi:hypothetical protein
MKTTNMQNLNDPLPRIDPFSRRDFVTGAGVASLAASIPACFSKAEAAAPVPGARPPGAAVDVREFGAIGDGVTDDTAAFQKALDSCAPAKSGTVVVPDGAFAIRGHLDVPEGVALCGTLQTVAYAIGAPEGGSRLLAFEGAGNGSGTPFITLNTNSTLKGLKIFYPEQTKTNPPVAYPWTVASGGGRNLSIIDVLMVNPYQAVDFGSRVATPHYIRNLYAYPLYRGIYVDRCYDCGKMENVIFWPFWVPDMQAPLNDFVRENCEAFIFGRTDWQVLINCFTICTKVGFRFVDHNPAGLARFEPAPEAGGGASGPNVMIFGGGADMCGEAVRVEQCQRHSGVSFVNSQIYGDTIVEKTNCGPVKFTACGFFGSLDGRRGIGIARTDGPGRVSFEGCHFFLYTGREKCNPETLFLVEGGRIGINNCCFHPNAKDTTYADPVAVVLKKPVLAAIITGNEFYGQARITNEVPDRSTIANNIEGTAER